MCLPSLASRSPIPLASAWPASAQPDPLRPKAAAHRRKAESARSMPTHHVTVITWAPGATALLLGTLA